MEYLQYITSDQNVVSIGMSFKPYYKWNTFNTASGTLRQLDANVGFKPYYKWNTFNTIDIYPTTPIFYAVLNLIINGIPSILLLLKHQQWLKSKF